MDPFLHPTGWEEPPRGLVTYHANYAANEAKIEKLKKAGVWDAWSTEEKKCVSARQTYCHRCAMVWVCVPGCPTPRKRVKYRKPEIFVS